MPSPARRATSSALRRDGTDYVFTPFGRLADANPFDAYVPALATLPDNPTA